MRGVCPRNLVLEGLEEAVIRAVKQVTAHGSAALVKPPLVQGDLALGNALVEDGNVVGEHLCFFGKELWLGLLSTKQAVDDFNFFKTKTVYVYFCFDFCFTCSHARTNRARNTNRDLTPQIFNFSGRS